jgi:hypothetical protein
VLQGQLSDVLDRGGELFQYFAAFGLNVVAETSE